MTGLLMFVLPNGRSAEMADASARLICDRLWALGIAPGAATAAARVSAALRRHPAASRNVDFLEREIAPLLEACDELTGTPAQAADIETLRSNLLSDG
jgi:hypothetical protein